MKRISFFFFFLLAGAALAQQAPVPEIPYRSVPDFLKLPPDLYFGEVAGVAVNSDGHVFVFSRGNTTGPAYGATAAQLLEFDAHGNFVREIGHNLYAWSFAHTVKVDPQDNIWATDKGSDMVIKFNPAGRVVMVFGRKQEASDEGTGPLKHCARRCRPSTECSARSPTSPGTPQATPTSATATSIRASPRSTRTETGSSPGASPATGPGQFNTPHSIAADAQGNIYVADRGNRRIQVFDGDGNFLRQIHHRRSRAAQRAPRDRPRPTATTGTMAPGAPWAICITPGPHQFLYSADAYPGRIYKLTLDGKVLGMLGRIGQTAQAVRLDPRNRLPIRKRALRRRAPELARPKISPRAIALAAIA